jgi:hypothetical protein
MYLSLLIITVVMLSIAMLGMMLKILVRKKGKFPEYRVGHNRDMHKLGISCVKRDEIKCHQEMLKGNQGCAGCV